MRHRPTGGAPGRPPVSAWSTFAGAAAYPRAEYSLVFTVVVLLLLAAKGFVRGRAGHTRMAIRGIDVANPDHRHSPATDQTARAPFEIDRSFQISMRKEGLRAAASTTFKLPFSHCIFDRWRVRNIPAVGNGGGAMAVWQAHRAERVALQFWGEYLL
jgi:hypothetical protein